MIHMPLSVIDLMLGALIYNRYRRTVYATFQDLAKPGMILTCMSRSEEVFLQQAR